MHADRAEDVLLSGADVLRRESGSKVLATVDAVPEASRANANDRLALASLGRVEGGDGIVEGRDVADVRA